MANNAILGAMLLLIKTKADTSGLNKTDKALRKTGGAIKSMSKDIGLIGKLSKGFLGYLGVRGIGGIFNSYLQFEKDYGAMKSRFYAITKDDKLAGEEFNYIRGVAVETANSIKAVADSYSIFYAAAHRPLGQKNARNIFETWTKISRVLHLSEAQFERVTYALREMSSKGQLYSQDLKIQLGTHVPDAINIAETAIQNLGIKGVETVEDFQQHTKKDPRGGWMAKFLIEFSKEAGRRFASPEALKKALAQPDALQQSILLLKDLFLYEFSDAGGNKAIINILTGIRNALMQIDYKGLAQSLAKVAEGMSVVFDYLPQIFSVLKDIALSVAILYGFKALTRFFTSIGKTINVVKSFFPVFLGTFKLFSKSAPFLTKLFYSLGYAFPALAKILLPIAQKGIVGIVGGLLGASGPLGWIAGALMFLPEIVSIVKWIGTKLGWKDTHSIVNGMVSNTDISMAQVRDMLEYLNKKGISTSSELQKELKAHGMKDIMNQYHFNDSGDIIFYINDQEFNVEKMAKEIEEKKSKFRGLDVYKPKQYTQQEALKAGF